MMCVLHLCVLSFFSPTTGSPIGSPTGFSMRPLSHSLDKEADKPEESGEPVEHTPSASTVVGDSLAQQLMCFSSGSSFNSDGSLNSESVTGEYSFAVHIPIDVREMRGGDDLARRGCFYRFCQSDCAVYALGACVPAVSLGLFGLVAGLIIYFP